MSRLDRSNQSLSFFFTKVEPQIQKMADHQMKKCPICLDPSKTRSTDTICVRTQCACYYPANIFHGTCIAKHIHFAESMAVFGRQVPFSDFPLNFNMRGNPTCPNCRTPIQNAQELWRQEKIFDNLYGDVCVCYHHINDPFWNHRATLRNIVYSIVLDHEVINID